MSSAMARQPRRTFVDRAGVELGLEPPIEPGGRSATPFDRRRVSFRWLCGTLLLGVSGAVLIGTAIYAALDRQATVIEAPEYAAGTTGGADGPG